MSFQQGLSGLNASSKSLEVIGNNVANASTVGFKQSRAQFSDVYANSLMGSGASQIGIGTNISAVAQQFTQGNISGTNNTMDISINGAGFYIMETNGATTYTRNGQFQLDKLGYITDSQGNFLKGFQADAGGTLAATVPTVPIQINSTDLVPLASTEVETAVTLDSRLTPLTSAGFDFTDPATYHNSTAISVFDTLGNSHTLQQFYVKTGPNTWDVFAAADGVATPAFTAPATQSPITTVTFNSSGSVASGGTGSVTFAPMTGGTATGAANVTVSIDVSDSKQFGSSFSVNINRQDGYTSGRLAAFNTGADGIILGNYTNGQTKILGQVVLANFKNMNGLKPLGGNGWAESSESGEAILGTPNSGQFGVLQSSSQEDSNVDLTAELVNMITAQRIYQANAQTIKTQDQVLQTLVNLR